MTNQLLVSLIAGLCSNGPKEVRIECFEYYVNCAVRINGTLSERDFKTKCLKGVQNEQSN